MNLSPLLKKSGHYNDSKKTFSLRDWKVLEEMSIPSVVEYMGE